MPYNTRRKSLSLAELGIVVPKRSRTESHPSPPSTVADGEEPVNKKSKLSHSSTSPPPAGLMSPPRTTNIRVKEEPAKPATELSPPPSPAREGSNKVDIEGINDNIVVATIQQLEKTGNRPIFVKELAHVLAARLTCVEKSANPTALISSRLTSYLQRPWPAISPCPLAKDLSPVHPRRLYFYLTTMQAQALPDPSEMMLPKPRIISPSLSSASAADEEDDRYNRQRTALSPSPEVDLSSPELDGDNAQEAPEPGVPFASARNSVPRDSRASSLSQHRRAASPQLEREERDFKQTANQLYEQAQLRRRNSQKRDDDVKMEQDDTTGGAEHDTESVTMSIEEDEELAARKNSIDAAALFGHQESLQQSSHLMDFSSPVLHPQHNVSRTIPEHQDSMMSALSLDVGATSTDVSPSDATLGWDSLQSPENIELAELEDMFDSY
ncbi:hypothetical protein Tdes44962_MAKER01392 [Teratosphaeria destructans]|uniref:GDS1 winged helix domain-containing protein n=1 Tax=Teratosphaeria destructans TaxID=418781 RepID=A0A9W7SZU7_9PEZI|nr:hypothetical protein Tdes44962_MAKER01392 [Teratosphaeria destructans]